MKYCIENIGKRIKIEGERERTELGIKSWEDYAVNHLHISRSTLDNWTKGKGLSLETLLFLCEEFDCELGYLLCENGYENKTREATDICEATGLSEEAVKVLKKEAERIQERNKYNSKYNHPPIETTIKTGFISCLLESSTGIFDTLRDFMQHEAEMKEVRQLPFFQDIEKLFFEAQKKKYWNFDIKTGEPLLKDCKEYFNDSLKEFLDEYNKADEYGINSLVKMITSDDILLDDDEKERIVKKLENVNFANEMFIDLAYRREIYDLLEIEQKKKYFKYELSDNFMDIVKDYIKEGTEDGGKD